MDWKIMSDIDMIGGCPHENRYEEKSAKPFCAQNLREWENGFYIVHRVGFLSFGTQMREILLNLIQN